MNADMLNRGTEDRPPHSLSLSLFLSLFFFRRGVRPLWIRHCRKLTGYTTERVTFLIILEVLLTT